jgi:tetratricopeptide (TPR) repeat protein
VRATFFIPLVLLAIGNGLCEAALTKSPLGELRAELALATDEADKQAIIELTRRILDLAPSDAKIWEQLARTQFETKDTDRCSKTLDIWEKNAKPRPPVIDDIRGDVANAREQFKDAERYWRAFVAVQPKAGDTLDKIVDLFERRKAWRAGLEISNRAIAVKDTAGRRVLRARFYLRLRNWDAALADIHKANALDASDASVKTWLPKFEQLQKYLPRIKALDAVLAKPGDTAEPWLDRARLLVLSGQPDLALNDAIEAFDNRLPKQSMRARIQSGEALQDVGRSEDAAKMNVAHDLIRAEDHHVSEKALSSLWESDTRISQNPDKTEPLTERANVLRRLNQYVLALTDAQAALDIDPRNGPAHFESAHALDGLGRFSEALKHAVTATEINPNSAVSWYYRGILEAHQADFSAAIESQKRSLAVRESVVALREREKCERRLGRIREAEADSRRLSEIGNQSGESLSP